LLSLALEKSLNEQQKGDSEEEASQNLLDKSISDNEEEIVKENNNLRTNLLNTSTMTPPSFSTPPSSSKMKIKVAVDSFNETKLVDVENPDPLTENQQKWILACIHKERYAKEGSKSFSTPMYSQKYRDSLSQSSPQTPVTPLSNKRSHNQVNNGNKDTQQKKAKKQ